MPALPNLAIYHLPSAYACKAVRERTAIRSCPLLRYGDFARSSNEHRSNVGGVASAPCPRACRHSRRWRAPQRCVELHPQVRVECRERHVLGRVAPGWDGLDRHDPRQ